MQGYNIRLLTLVSIFFLPLTFVTSVFGMTNMPPKGSFKPFGIVTAAICVPTYFFLISVNSPETAASAIKRVGWVLTLILSGFRPHSQRMQAYERKYKMGAYKTRSNEREPKRFAARTLSSYEKVEPKPTLVDPRRPSRAPLHDEKDIGRPPKVHGRTSEMIKFDLPDYDIRPTKADSRALEKTLSDPGPIAGEADRGKRGFLRSFSDRFGGNPSPRSSRMLV
jgi:hypothetical protein